jgi:hypothetical protein
MIDPMMIDSEPEQQWALSEDVTSAPNEASEMEEAETEEDELTPRPRMEENQDQLRRIFDLSADDDDSPFQTPLALHQKKRVVMDSDDLDNQIETKEGQKEAMKRKRDQGRIGKKDKRKGDGKKKVGVKLKRYQYPYHCSI